MKKWVVLLLLPAVWAGMGVAAADEGTPAEPNNGATPSNPVVTIATSKGDIVVELDAAKAPISVANFLAYTKDGFYDGTIFHRVIAGFMVQGGGMTADMRKKPTQDPIKNEAGNGLKNKRGTIAMARTNVPDSATSQFFINHKDNAFLDFRNPSPQGIGYAVFGKVIRGMEVVDAIAAVATRKPGDVPLETVTIESVTVAEPPCAGKLAGETACDKKDDCEKDCDKCPRKETKDCPKQNGECGKAAKK